LRVEVVRSTRRRKTVHASLDGDLVRVRMPAWMSKADEDRYVAELVGRLERRHERDRIDPEARAAKLASRYGLPRPAGVRWIRDGRTQWASCTIGTREIRITERLATYPSWVLDYVLIHELAHLVEANHSARFWAIVNRYPKAERARGFLIAKGMEDDR
jgi:predicted metal-dependent hydrolase